MKGSLRVVDIKEWLRVQELDMQTLGSDKKKGSSDMNYLMDSEDVHAFEAVTEDDEISDGEELGEVGGDGKTPTGVDFSEAEAQEIMISELRRVETLQEVLGQDAQGS